MNANTRLTPYPNFITYTRADGSTFMVGRVLGVYIIVGFEGHYPTRRDAVVTGHAMARWTAGAH